jgi:hypothetical protein
MSNVVPDVLHQTLSTAISVNLPTLSRRSYILHLHLPTLILTQPCALCVHRSFITLTLSNAPSDQDLSAPTLSDMPIDQDLVAPTLSDMPFERDFL